MVKCIGLCKQLPTKHTNNVPWIGITAYLCPNCSSRIAIEDAERGKKGNAICPCCKRSLRTTARTKGKWERFAA